MIVTQVTFTATVQFSASGTARLIVVVTRGSWPLLCSTPRRVVTKLTSFWAGIGAGRAAAESVGRVVAI